MHLLHDTWSQITDGLSFGFINLLQARRRAGKHSHEAFMAYCKQWEGLTLGDYYHLPEEVPLLDLPESGSFQTESPIPNPQFTDHPENDHLNCDIWLGPKGWQSPTMFMLHGVMSVSDVGYRLWAKKLNSLGWTAIFFHLPYHYSRKPKNCLSGEIAFSSNLIRTAEGIRQAVIELRLVCRSLKAKGVPSIGLWGTSYGGWIASLLIMLEDIVTTAWLLEPIADVEHAIWKSPAAITMRQQLRQIGITAEDVQRFLPFVCPSYHKPLLDMHKILLIGGSFDLIAPVVSMKKLHQLWNGSHFYEFRQGHIGYQLMPESLRLAQEIMPELFIKKENF